MEEPHPFVKEYVDRAEKEEKRSRKGHGILLVVAAITLGVGLFMGSTAITGLAIGGEFSNFVVPLTAAGILAALFLMWLDLNR